MCIRDRYREELMNRSIIYFLNPIFGATLAILQLFNPHFIEELKKVLLRSGRSKTILAWMGFLLLFPLCLCFPVAMILFHIYVVFFAPSNEELKNKVKVLISIEAFFESSPQMHLQIYTIINGYKGSMYYILCLSK